MSSQDVNSYPVVDPDAYADEQEPSIPRGPRRSSRLLVAAGVLFTALVLAFAVWAGLGNAEDAVSFRDIGYNVDSPAQVTATFEVVKPADREVTCLVRALDKRYGVVGSVDVRIPAGEETVMKTVTIRTTALAVTGTARSCTIVE